MNLIVTVRNALLDILLDSNVMKCSTVPWVAPGAKSNDPKTC
jgi:hypothetical protein